MVAAEGFELNTGWPYARLLELAKNEHVQQAQGPALQLPTPELAKSIVRRYTEYYRNYELADVSTDMAALQLNALNGLVPAVNNLCTAMIKSIQDPQVQGAIVLAHWNAQSYKNDQHVDLYDFCECLKRQYAGFTDHCENVMKEIRNVVLLSCSTGAAFQYSHGLSVFFPWADIEDVEETSELGLYQKQLAWAEPSYWAGFLREYLKYTQRLPRGCESLAELEADQAQKNPADRKFRKSRLNRRFGYFRSLAGEHRWDPPQSKWDPPQSKMGGGTGRIGDVKNPPIHWAPRNC
jgi:hypothetical protein